MSEYTGNMYENTKTWNPAVGCSFDCVYCEKSFKKILRWVAGFSGCKQCYDYEPHEHPERIGKVPSSPIIFVFGHGDISFYRPDYIRGTFNTIDRHKPRKKKTYYFQSKAPVCFNRYMGWFNENQEKVKLLTTLETNRDEGYDVISKAPSPSKRFKDFYDLDYPNKVLTIEPVLDFDLNEFSEMVFSLHDQGSLNYVYFGFDSKNCGLPEPSEEKAQTFVDLLQDYGIEVIGKTLRGIKIRTRN